MWESNLKENKKQMKPMCEIIETLNKRRPDHIIQSPDLGRPDEGVGASAKKILKKQIF
jgi:hypothetical protein